jgi:hypothetical protein
MITLFYNRNDSTISIVTGYGLDDRVLFPRGEGVFLLDSRPDHPPVRRLPAVVSSGVKRPQRKADHSPPSSVEVKK